MPVAVKLDAAISALAGVLLTGPSFGAGLGLESTAMPVIVISIAIISAYWLGQTSGLVDKITGQPTGGL